MSVVRASRRADRAVILDTGEVAFTGAAADVLADQDLRRQYLAV